MKCHYQSTEQHIFKHIFTIMSGQKHLFFKKKKRIKHCNLEKKNPAASEFEFPTEFHVHGMVTIKQKVNYATQEGQRNLLGMLANQLLAKISKYGNLRNKIMFGNQQLHKPQALLHNPLLYN